MENTESEILDSNFIQHEIPKRRRKLLPWWMKTFTWIFLIFGAIAPVGLILGIFGLEFQLSLYGLETNTPLSVTGLCLIVIFLFKGITAFGLWTEKDWAINLGLIDAVLGICVCVFIMIIYPLIDNQPGFELRFRFELLLLILFLVRLVKIKSEWNEIPVLNKSFWE